MALHALGSKRVPNQWLEVLVDASEDDVSSLLRLRPDLALGTPKDLAELATNALTPASALMFHEDADRTTREVLEALCVLPPPVTEASLASALVCPAGELSSLLKGLRLAAMVLVEADGSVVVNPGLAGGLQWPARLGPPAAAVLGRETNSHLMAVASRLGLSPNGNKTDLVKRLTRALSEPRRMASLLEVAPAGAAELVAKATHWPKLELYYGAAELARHDNNPAGWCLQRSLLVATGYSTVVMPREVGLALRGGLPFPGFTAVPPQLVLRSADQEAIDSMAADTALELVRDVETICDGLGALPAKPLQAGGLGVKELRRLAKPVGKPEQAVARLVELAGWAGLVEHDEEAGWAAPTGDYDRWRSSSSAERWVELASRWLCLPVHLSVAGSKEADGKLVPPLLDRAGDPNAMMQRALVMDVVAGAARGQVASEETVAEVANWRRPSTWLSPLAPPHELVHWLLEEAVVVGLAAGVGPGGQAVALSSFGLLLAEGDTEGAGKLLSGLVPAVVDRVIFQADLTATAAGEAAPGLRSELDLLADFESGGHATVWRFSQASLRRGFDAGRRAAEIQAFLERHAVHGVPQALSYLVDDMGRRYGRARVGRAASYVRSDEPSLLAELQTDRRLSSLGLRLLAPTVAVSSVTPPEVAAALGRAGYLPASEELDGTLCVSRPPLRRAGQSAINPGIAPDEGEPDRGEPAAWAPEGRASSSWSPNALLDTLRSLKEPDETEEEMLAEFLEDPELLSDVIGIPPHLAKMVLQMASGGGPQSDDDIDVLAAKLKSTPLPAQEPPLSLRLGTRGLAAPRPGISDVERPAPVLSLFSDDQPRPTHIAKEAREVAELLESSLSESWPLRVSYVNSQGTKSEFFVEVLSIAGDRVRIRFLGDRAGGGELATWRVQWARVVTEAEEAQLL